MKRFLLYILRWQLSTPILALVTGWLAWMGYWYAAAVANLIGACIFFWVDRWIFKGGNGAQRLYPRLKFADTFTVNEQIDYIRDELWEAMEAVSDRERDAEISDVEQAIQTYWDIRAKQGLDVDAVRAGTVEKNKARGYEP